MTDTLPPYDLLVWMEIQTELMVMAAERFEETGDRRWALAHLSARNSMRSLMPEDEAT